MVLPLWRSWEIAEFMLEGISDVSVNSTVPGLVGCVSGIGEGERAVRRYYCYSYYYSYYYLGGGGGEGENIERFVRTSLQGYGDGWGRFWFSG